MGIIRHDFHSIQYTTAFDGQANGETYKKTTKQGDQQFVFRFNPLKGIR